MSGAAIAGIIVMILLVGITAWGFMTDWTFSGLLPRKGAKCTPKDADKDENAKQYVYDKDKKCKAIQSCKVGWEPNSSNTSCEYSKADQVCTPTGQSIVNGKYQFNDEGACKLIGCKGKFKMPTCTTCNDGFRVSDDSKSCIDEFEPLTDVKAYQMDGYYEKDIIGDYVELGKVKTVEECRKLADEKDGVAIGVRTTKWGKSGDEYHKTCWYQGLKWEPDTSKIVGQGAHYFECLDKTKKPEDGCK